MTASGFGHLQEKVNFLAKFNHSPYKGGKWLGVQRMAGSAFIKAVRDRDPVAVQLFGAVVGSICSDKGWAGPETASLGEDKALLVVVDAFVLCVDLHELACCFAQPMLF